jgi:hypothetical protein
VTSVAYEELALSHILNAEGEKIQYALGTLPGNPNDATIGDVLDVNESVGTMLDTVLDNQMILSSKLTSALSATTSTGEIGPTGADGAAGGATGVIGATGATGEVGQIGARGALGDVGATGAVGATGNIGPTGATGVVRGAEGAVGAVGLQGEVGQRGAIGPENPITANYGLGYNEYSSSPVTFGSAYNIGINMLNITSGVVEYNNSQGFLISNMGYYQISYRMTSSNNPFFRSFVTANDVEIPKSRLFGGDPFTKQKSFLYYNDSPPTVLRLMYVEENYDGVLILPGQVQWMIIKLADGPPPNP